MAIYMWREYTPYVVNAHTYAYLPLDSVNGKTNLGTSGSFTGDADGYGLYGGVECGKFTSDVISKSAFLTGSFTAAMRIKPTNSVYCAGVSFVRVKPLDNGYQFMTQLKGGSYDNVTISGPTLGKWNLIVFTYQQTADNNGPVNFYIKGEGNYTGSLTMRNDAYNMVMALGYYQNSSSTREGYMADFIVEDIVRTESKINEYYNNTKAKFGY